MHVTGLCCNHIWDSSAKSADDQTLDPPIAPRSPLCPPGASPASAPVGLLCCYGLMLMLQPCSAAHMDSVNKRAHTHTPSLQPSPPNHSRTVMVRVPGAPRPQGTPGINGRTDKLIHKHAHPSPLLHPSTSNDTYRDGQDARGNSQRPPVVRPQEALPVIPGFGYHYMQKGGRE